jgi:hypothetical protein
MLVKMRTSLRQRWPAHRCDFNLRSPLIDQSANREMFDEGAQLWLLPRLRVVAIGAAALVY